jgi:type II secretory pathway component PulF
MSATGVFPSFVTRMVHVGESSGNLPEGFEKTVQYYDKEIPRIVGEVFAILEPLIIVILGLAVAFLAFVVFLPLTELFQRIG